MFELTIDQTAAAGPASLAAAGAVQLRRRGRGLSVRKNVCFVTLNGSGNGISFWNIMNGFGGF